MAPSTPPPPRNVRLAAFTIASSSSEVMSATQTSSRAAPTSAMSRAVAGDIDTRLSRPFGLRFRAQIDRALHADIVEMLVEETPRRALAAQVQHLEEIVVGRQLAEGVEMRPEAIEYNAVHVDAAILTGPGAARQPALIDQTRHEFDGAIFADQRGVECDLVDTIHDLARRH